MHFPSALLALLLLFNPFQSPGDSFRKHYEAAEAHRRAGNFAAAEAEFDKLLAANPSDAEAQAGKAQAGLFARATRFDPQIVLAAARADDSVGVQLDAADVEMVSGQVEAAFDRLINLIKIKAGDERNQVRVRLLELFETVGNADPRVLKARRDLMTALF
jgi:putative thioredoxin